MQAWGDHLGDVTATIYMTIRNTTFLSTTYKGPPLNLALTCPAASGEMVGTYIGHRSNSDIVVW